MEIQLSEYAQLLYEKESKNREETPLWLNDYVSRHIINDFNSPKNKLISELNDVTKVRNDADAMIAKLVERLKFLTE